DLGFFVTPGRLLALFDPVLGQTPVAAGGAVAARDFSRKYLDRLPGLRIEAGAGTVTVPLRATLAAATPCRVWLRADQAVTATVAGTAVAIPAGGDYAPFPVSLTGATAVFAASAEPYWVALVETEAPAATDALFHWAAGGFQIEGLLAEAREVAWPDLAGPAGAALQAASAGAAGSLWVAYLELWEQVVTAVEDPGLREQALGSDRETTSRSAVMAQVKLAPVAGLVGPDAVAEAFGRTIAPSGRVTFGTSAGSAAADPCDLPVPGGYSGPDNRLYRLAVHEVATVGPNQVTRFKWSRDNAGDLWSCSLMPDQPPGANVTHVRVGASVPLRAGDLVELTSDAIERGDAASGAVSAAGFARPRRSQGRLFRLTGGDLVTGSFREFQLLDPLTETPVAPFAPGPFGAEGLKLRRWSGLLERTGSGAATLTLEHGLIADVTGDFEPGDWWQAEARVLAPQANGPVVTTAHGPERLFAPLALLERGAANTPLILRGWLDSRARRLCAQEADFTAYDGARVGTDADTVQEALDELFLRLSGGCGEISVPPTAALQAVIDTIPPGADARICLNGGTRDLAAAVVVADKGDLILTGIGPGTLLRGAGRRVIRFERCRSVDLRDFAVQAQSGGNGAVIDFVECGEVRLDGVRLTAAGPVEPRSSAIRQVSSANRPTRSFTMRHCRLSLGMFDTGVTAADPGQAVIEDNEITVPPTNLSFLTALTGDSETLYATGAVLMDRMWFYSGDGGFDFVGGPVFNIPPRGPGTVARSGLVMANGIWGGQHDDLHHPCLARHRPVGTAGRGQPAARRQYRTARRDGGLSEGLPPWAGAADLRGRRQLRHHRAGLRHPFRHPAPRASGLERSDPRPHRDRRRRHPRPVPVAGPEPAGGAAAVGRAAAGRADPRQPDHRLRPGRAGGGLVAQHEYHLPVHRQRRSAGQCHRAAPALAGPPARRDLDRQRLDRPGERQPDRRTGLCRPFRRRAGDRHRCR
ncbi:MAG: hypothetical protein JNK88_08465, partial [Mangrovicoccus sp.]|nr:hypothetical protein [Mangrovicoccus sp.]